VLLNLVQLVGGVGHLEVVLADADDDAGPLEPSVLVELLASWTQPCASRNAESLLLFESAIKASSSSMSSK
jgi:hypothetical protein